jgi:hypothetical protein
MARRQLPRRLFKGRDVVTPYKNEPTGTKLMRRMADEHEDVLQNIEFAIVNAHKNDPGIDDAIAHEALRAALHGEEPSDPRAADLLEALDVMREFRQDVDDDVWDKALRVIDDSVRRHSQLAPGETSYLSFVRQFVR